MLSNIPHVHGLVQGLVACRFPPRNEFTSVLFDDGIDVAAGGGGGMEERDVRESLWGWQSQAANAGSSASDIDGELDAESSKLVDDLREPGPRVLVIKNDAIVDTLGLPTNPFADVDSLAVDAYNENEEIHILAEPEGSPQLLTLTSPLPLSGRIGHDTVPDIEERLQSRVRKGPVLNISSKGYVRSAKLNPPATLLALLRSPKVLELLLVPSLVPVHTVSRPQRSSEAILGFEWIAPRELLVVATTGVELVRWSRSGRKWMVGKQVKMSVGWYGWSSPSRLLLLFSDSSPDRLLLYHFPPGAPFTQFHPLRLPSGPRPLRRNFACVVAHSRCWVVGTAGGRVSLWRVSRTKVEDSGAWDVGDGVWVVGPVVDSVVMVHDVRGKTTVLLDPRFGPLALTTLPSPDSTSSTSPYDSLSDPTTLPPPSTPYLPHPSSGTILFLRLDLPLLARAMMHHKTPRTPRSVVAMIVHRCAAGRAEAVKGIVREGVAKLAQAPGNVVERVEEVRGYVEDAIGEVEGKEGQNGWEALVGDAPMERPVVAEEVLIREAYLVEGVVGGVEGKEFPSDILLHLYVSLLPLLPSINPLLVQHMLSTQDILRLEDFISNGLVEASPDIARIIADAAAAAEEDSAPSGPEFRHDRTPTPTFSTAQLQTSAKASALRSLSRHVLRHARVHGFDDTVKANAEAEYVEELLRLGRPLDALRLAHGRGLVRGLGGGSWPGRGPGSGASSPRPGVKGWKAPPAGPGGGLSAAMRCTGQVPPQAQNQIRPSRFLEVARGTNDIAVFYHVYWFLHANGHLSYPAFGQGNGANSNGSMNKSQARREDSEVSIGDELEERKIMIYSAEVKQFFEGREQSL
ncbi:hypothetical protein M427DRAFT_75296 [Gonapodya prolifera JEL478]|uniref:Regulator of MON1-CCZ1 complex N-terminal domain-containing protein n=1 Tax=Gonapodya prolifera (strain JEL478) TaxID=1344416 RepID=A0A138ZZN1_GONPJ|nr:hypothetical protein M427DRAFT_75296 [Gonapodya prolifera JEL478]|eukprot:KXS09593.1 hypothetical protein M427DRAFT_75296 [Gonapodya prolifera JEL478]